MHRVGTLSTKVVRPGVGTGPVPVESVWMDGYCPASSGASHGQKI